MPEINIRRSALDSLESQQRFDTILAEIDNLDGFDVAFGVETSRPVEPWEIREADDTTLVNNSRYSPTPVRTIRQVISAAGVRYGDMSFVDFGSGKGRVLFVAAEFPFRRVIGVEFSSELCEIARKNAASYSAKTSNERPVDVFCGDAPILESPTTRASSTSTNRSPRPSPSGCSTISRRPSPGPRAPWCCVWWGRPWCPSWRGAPRGRSGAGRSLPRTTRTSKPGSIRTHGT